MKCVLLFFIAWFCISTVFSVPVMIGTSFDHENQRSIAFVVSGTTMYRSVLSYFPLDVNGTFCFVEKYNEVPTLFVFSEDSSFQGLYLSQVNLITFETTVLSTFYVHLNDPIHFFSLPLGMLVLDHRDTGQEILVLYKQRDEVVVAVMNCKTKQTTSNVLVVGKKCYDLISNVFLFEEDYIFALQCQDGTYQIRIRRVNTASLMVVASEQFLEHYSNLFYTSDSKQALLTIGVNQQNITVVANGTLPIMSTINDLQNSTISPSFIQDNYTVYMMHGTSLVSISKSSYIISMEALNLDTKKGIFTANRRLLGLLQTENLAIDAIFPSLLPLNTTMFLSAIVSHRWITERAYFTLNNNINLDISSFIAPCFSLNASSYAVVYPKQVVCMEVLLPKTSMENATLNLAIAPGVIVGTTQRVSVKPMTLSAANNIVNPSTKLPLGLDSKFIADLDVKCSLTFRNMKGDFETYFTDVMLDFSQYFCKIPNFLPYLVQDDKSSFALVNIVNMGKALLPESKVFLLNNTLMLQEIFDRSFTSRFVYNFNIYNFRNVSGTELLYVSTTDSTETALITEATTPTFENTNITIHFAISDATSRGATKLIFIKLLVRDGNEVEFYVNSDGIQYSSAGASFSSTCSALRNINFGQFYFSVVVDGASAQVYLLSEDFDIICSEMFSFVFYSSNNLRNGGKISVGFQPSTSQTLEILFIQLKATSTVSLQQADPLFALSASAFIAQLYTFVIQYVATGLFLIVFFGWPVILGLLVGIVVFLIIFCVKVIPALFVAKVKHNIVPFSEFPVNTKQAPSEPHNVKVTKASYHLPFRGILKNADLLIPSGRLTVIMGPSGGGKSTLLNLLSSRFELGMVNPTSQVHINGALSRFGWLVNVYGMKHTAVVPQQEIMLKSFSVIETLQFAAMLRGSFRTARSTGNIVMRLLDLHERKTNMISQLSGGQQKRVNIGIELCSSHDILLLDEPTTGLDSETSKKLMLFLKRYAYMYNIPVVCVIHQPQKELFDEFDQLVIVAKNKIVYSGPPGSSVNYLANHNFSFQQVAASNPADLVIDCLQVPENKDALENIQPIVCGPPEQSTEGLTHFIKDVFLDKVSFFPHFFVCLLRNTLQLFKEFWFALASLSVIIFTGLIIGLLFREKYYVGINDSRLQDICPIDFNCAVINDPLQNTFVFFLLGISLCAITTGITIFQREFTNYKRESASGVNTLAYFIAKDVTHFLTTTVFSTIAYVAIVFGLTSPKMSVILFFFIHLITFYVFFGAGFVISLLVPENISQVTGVVFLFINFILSGFRPNTYKVWRKRNFSIFYATPFSYLLEWLYLSELSMYSDQYNIQESLNEYGYSFADLILCYFVPIVVGLAFRIISIFLLYTRNPSSLFFNFTLLLRNCIAFGIAALNYPKDFIFKLCKLLISKLVFVKMVSTPYQISESSGTVVDKSQYAEAQEMELRQTDNSESNFVL